MQIPPNGEFPKVNGVGSTQKNTNNSTSSSDKVQRLREAIANGTYQVDTGKIAEKMIDSGILSNK